MNKIISTPAAPKPAGPYSQAIRSGSTVYCAGQIPIDPKTGELVANDIALQTRRVLQNLRAVLSAQGMSLLHVVKTTVFLADMRDYPAMNEAYADTMAGHLPARTTVEVSGLPRGARIEIDAVAVAE
jgi:2-iminobutanoate/2-iminopropanoate deaminase